MILVIETSTAACSVALVEGARIVGHRHEEVGRGHAERLVPMIASLLGRERPAAVAVGCGPGSFTGIRVGIAAARGLGLAWAIPVSGFPSLALLAAGAGAGRTCAVAVPGGHGELFVGRFTGDPVRQLAAPVSLAPEAAAERIGDEFVLGPAAAALVAARGWGEAADASADAAAWIGIDPRDRQLSPSPVYGRAPDARPQVPA